jgi:hypothetical protein
MNKGGFAQNGTFAPLRGSHAMRDHPILGVVLFATGLILVAVAYAMPDGASALFAGHILVFNGALLSLLGCRKREMKLAPAPRPANPRNPSRRH